MLVISSCATQYILIAYCSLPTQLCMDFVCLPAKLLQLWLTLGDPMDCSPPGSLLLVILVPLVLRLKYWSELSGPPPGALPDPISCIAGALYC